MKINEVSLENVAFEKFFHKILIKKNKIHNKKLKKDKNKPQRVNSSSIITRYIAKENRVSKSPVKTRIKISNCMIL